jgi:uncharacterized protein (TIGR02453 family)
MTMLEPRLVEFLTGLAANNSKDWFTAHKGEYDSAFKRAGEAFAVALAEQLEQLLGSAMQWRIFRLHRDVRFSKDKTPYNTHLRIALTPENAAKDGVPAWLFGIEQTVCVLGMGQFEFLPEQLTRWREHVAGAGGRDTATLIDELAAGGVRFGDPELKRVPAPFAADHQQARLLRHKGLTAWLDYPDAALAMGEQGPANCARELARLRRLHELLLAATG